MKDKISKSNIFKATVSTALVCMMIGTLTLSVFATDSNTNQDTNQNFLIHDN